MKKNMYILLVFILLFAAVMPAYAEDNGVKVQVNGEYISFDQAPQVVDGSTLLPIQTVLEQLKAKVTWDENTKTLTAVKDDVTISIQDNNSVVKMEKNKVTSEIEMSPAPKMINNTLFTSVRFLSDVFPVQVGWDENANAVIILDYTYFVDILKDKAPVFYSFLTDEYTSVQKGKVEYDFSFDFKANPKGEEIDSFTPLFAGPIDMGLDGKFSGLVNENKASIDGSLTAKGMLKEFLNDESLGLKGLDQINFKLLLGEDGIYIKSDLFSKIPELSQMPIQDKWIAIKYSDEDKDDMKKMYDSLKNNDVKPLDIYLYLLKELNTNINADTFKEMKEASTILFYFVNDDHFKVQNVDKDTKTYNLVFTEKDIVKLVSMLEVLSKEENEEMLKDLKDLKFNYNLDVTVKNKSIVNENLIFKMQMNSPTEGSFDLDVKLKVNVENRNDSSIQIDMPKDSEVINIDELQ